jgi:endonuclease YncB( thermonuclease family)
MMPRVPINLPIQSAVLRPLALALLCSLAFAGAANAAELRGRVVGIADGDTLTLLTDQREQVRIRLAEIDTPERRQPYGDRARQALAALTFGRAVEVEVVDTDRYGRTVGRVRAGAEDVNAELVRRGAAWVYRRYSRDPSLLRLEDDARAARRGLWALPAAERVPPWEWRAARR